jgi:hypothetical protein
MTMRRFLLLCALVVAQLSVTGCPRRPDPYVQPSQPAYSTGGVSTGGVVHVRGYRRRDGTYVQPYTRRRPR